MRVLNISTPESVKDDISIMGIVISLNDLFYCSNDSMHFLLADAANRRYMNFSELNNVGMKFEPKNQGVQYVDIQHDTNSVTFL